MPDSFYKNLLDNLSDAIYFVDRDRAVTYWNKAAEALTGFKQAEVVGRRCSDNVLMHTDEQGNLLCAHGCPLSATIRDGQPCRVQVYLRHKDGHRVPVSVQASPIHDGQGQVVGGVESFHDHAGTLSLEQQVAELKQLALIDQLTQAGNRRYAGITLQGRLEELRRYGWPCGVVLSDLDHFKLVNDTHGHATGDRMLAMAAATLIGTTRGANASCFRWGGEEFLTVAANVSEAQLLALAERQRRLVAASALPHDGGYVNITISAGVALARLDDTPETLVRRADAALYESKQRGRNCSTVAR